MGWILLRNGKLAFKSAIRSHGDIYMYLFTFFAHAASFDCVKANTQSEKFICNNQKISRLDESLAKAYAISRSKLNEELREDLLETQRQWLKYWPLSCLNSSLSLEEQEDCTQNAYEQRIKELALQKNVMGKYLVYTSAYYWADAEDRTVTSWTYPQLVHDENDEQGKQINRWLKPSEKERERFLREEIGQITTTITVSTANILQATQDSYYEGGAHPTYFQSADYYHIQKSCALVARDIFQGTSWKTELAQIIFQKLKKGENELLIEKYQDLIPLIETPQRWRFTPKAFIVAFNIYDVAPFAAGPQTISIDWEQLMPYLTPFAIQEYKNK